MHPFASYVLRSYYRATGWNEDNQFSNLTRSSTAILDFSVPRGLHLSISKSANSMFNTSYAMNAMPSLNGSVGYIFSSCGLNIKSSRSVRFNDMVERFRVYDQPCTPEDRREEEWLAGSRVDSRDYFLYGRVYIPTGRLDALYSTRLSANLQALVAAISDPRSSSSSKRTRADTSSNIMFSLQHDTGKWCSEYSWSAEDGMLGAKVLHNFGKIGVPAQEIDLEVVPGGRMRRVDEEDPTHGGLKGRWAAGGEVYFSAKEKSAGISLGGRFSTYPDATPLSFLPPGSTATYTSRPCRQVPTTATILFNPMLGHIAGAYAARVTQDLALCSRYDFNVYSYDSEWTMGAEWWIRKPPVSQNVAKSEPVKREESLREDIHGVVKARASTNNNVSLMWEGRLKHMLISVGVISDLASRTKPIKSVGLELSYFSSESQ